MTLQLSPRDVVVEFVLEKIEAEPINRRILLYRCFAVETRNARLAEQCRTLAADLEQIEARHRQLVLDFRARAGRRAER